MSKVFEQIIFYDCNCCWRGNHAECPHGSHNAEECKCDETANNGEEVDE